MNKSAINKYAVWARTELMNRVAQKAEEFGISEAEIIPASADSIRGKLLTPTQKKQRAALIARIESKGKNGYIQVIEEVAYTWFNRFTAIRFMEANGYLPSHVRVFTDDENRFEPQILTEAIHLDLPGLDMDKVFEFKQKNDTEGLYKYLLKVQCNNFAEILPGMFQKIEDYTELLLPDNLLREGSIIARMISDIPEEDWTEQVEILGWLYQDYISTRHEEVIDPLRGKSIKKEDIPAATQLFTTDWVVRYMVDNSLGRYWIERHPESTLAEKLEFFVTPKDGKINYINESVTPQEMTFFDPCMGSGHILVYAFDVLMEIYRESGYSDRDAVAEIVQNNIFGLDIDDRCSQLAYFAVMMKARSYDRRFLTRGIEPHVYAIQESNEIGSFTRESITEDKELNKIGEYLVKVYRHAKEIGSIALVEPYNYVAFLEYLEKSADRSYLDMDLQMWIQYEKPLMEQLAKQAILMTKKYAVVSTNPPYLGKLEGQLKQYVLDNFKDYSGDLFSVFMYRNFGYCVNSGYSSFMTPNVWMSIKSYQALREYIMREKCIVSLVQMAHGAFNEVACVDVCSFIIKNKRERLDGSYIKLSEFKGGMDIQGQKCLFAIKNDCNYKFTANNEDLMMVPGSPITAYCATPKMLQLYRNAVLLEQIAEPKQGIATSDNNKFLRQWFEVGYNSIYLDCPNHESASNSHCRWYPYNKGGNFRKWYGNNDYVVDWENDGVRLKNFKGAVLRNPQFYFRDCISWSLISSYTIAFRYKPIGHLFDVAGMSCFSTGSVPLKYLLAISNCCLIGKIMMMLAPTINYQVGNIANIPVVYDKSREKDIIEIVERNIALTKADWDSYETSWDFSIDPLCKLRSCCNSISSAYEMLKRITNANYQELHCNEEKLNEILLSVYGLTGEVPVDVSRRDVSHTFIYDLKEQITEDIKESYYVRTKRDVIANFISYAVGCMFGRYSLDIDGLAYAGGKWDENKYRTFQADKDNVLPICDDEYFDDDIVGKFVRFVEAVYGKDTLEENLKFIADALGGSGTPRDVIRSYFLNDFYSDHIHTYQKRPIYWQFSSGKKDGFKCLIYMHRYQPDTIARIRTDYVHEQQARYRTAITDLEQRIQVASTSERVKLTKLLQKLKDQETEIRLFEEKVHHLADQMIRIDLDDGVKHNYEIFKDVLTKIK